MLTIGLPLLQSDASRSRPPNHFYHLLCLLLLLLLLRPSSPFSSSRKRSHGGKVIVVIMPRSLVLSRSRSLPLSCFFLISHSTEASMFVSFANPKKSYRARKPDEWSGKSSFFLPSVISSGNRSLSLVFIVIVSQQQLYSLFAYVSLPWFVRISCSPSTSSRSWWSMFCSDAPAAASSSLVVIPAAKIHLFLRNKDWVVRMGLYFATCVYLSCRIMYVVYRIINNILCIRRQFYGYWLARRILWNVCDESSNTWCNFVLTKKNNLHRLTKML